ncbi:hypothetical protein [Kitasatospora sp. NPDC004289]
MNAELASGLVSFEVHADLDLSDHSLLAMGFDRRALTELLNDFGWAA